MLLSNHWLHSGVSKDSNSVLNIQDSNPVLLVGFSHISLIHGCLEISSFFSCSLFPSFICFPWDLAAKSKGRDLTAVPSWWTHRMCELRPLPWAPNILSSFFNRLPGGMLWFLQLLWMRIHCVMSLGTSGSFHLRSSGFSLLPEVTFWDQSWWSCRQVFCFFLATRLMGS